MTPEPEWERYWRLYTFAWFALLVFGFGVPEWLALQGRGAPYSDSLVHWTEGAAQAALFATVCVGAAATCVWLVPHVFRRRGLRLCQQ